MYMSHAPWMAAVPAQPIQADVDMPPAAWAPYAERMFRRFPELFCTLGQPSLKESYDLSPAGGSEVDISKSPDGSLVVRINLAARKGYEDAMPWSFASETAASVPKVSFDSGSSVDDDVPDVPQVPPSPMQLQPAPAPTVQTSGVNPQNFVSAPSGFAEHSEPASQVPSPTACGVVKRGSDTVRFASQPVIVSEVAPQHHAQPVISAAPQIAPVQHETRAPLSQRCVRAEERQPSTPRSPKGRGAFSAASAARQEFNSMPMRRENSRRSQQSQPSPLRVPLTQPEEPPCGHVEVFPMTPAAAKKLPVQQGSGITPEKVDFLAPSANGTANGAGTPSTLASTENVSSRHSSPMKTTRTLSLSINLPDSDSACSTPFPTPPSQYLDAGKPAQNPLTLPVQIKRVSSLQVGTPLGDGKTPTCSPTSCKTPASEDSSMSSTTSLRARRKMNILNLGNAHSVSDLPSMVKKRDTKSFVSGGNLCSSPENQNPAVQKLSPTRPGSKSRADSCLPEDSALEMHMSSSLSLFSNPEPEGHRFLPAAFANQRTVIFFDWDDTLCPTTWIRSLLKDSLADLEAWEEWYRETPRWFNHPLPDVPAVWDQISELQDAVIRLINVAQAFGVVCIVTNAVQGWVDKTINKWLPKLQPYINGHGARPPIRVLYGQTVYRRDVHSSSSAGQLRDLGWIDELGECTWWKRTAFNMAVDGHEELYRLKRDHDAPLSWTQVHGSRRVDTIVSLGDSEAEMQAAQLYAQQYADVGCCGALPSNASRPGLPERAASAPTLSGALSLAGSSNGLATLAEAGRTSDGERGREREPRQRRRLGRGASPFSPSSRLGGVLGKASRASQRGSSAGITGRDVRRPWVKLAKITDGPDVRSLCQQLHEFSEALPDILATRSDLRVQLGRSGASVTGDGAATPSSAWGPQPKREDMKLSKGIWTQTL
eukprot:TRINITY_DN17046_c0_g2_i1.p1 TRINITY_DN17046_c0_g2~~TRINITY_DN17046_c0_g2_i1.p1  ORF type:complete len:938 (-),score=149.15 TRINITY_DN17046_c0_g2_i1:81-2894(-)